MIAIESFAQGTIERILSHEIAPGDEGPGIGLTGPLRVEFVRGERKARLLKEFVCQTPDWLISVPEGFETDFASIPRFFWRLLDPMDPEYRAIAVVHDYLYRAGALPREACDLIFGELMVQHGTGAWKRLLVRCGLRWFGWTGWRENRRREAAK